MCLRVSHGVSASALLTRGVGRFFTAEVSPEHPGVTFHMSMYGPFALLEGRRSPGARHPPPLRYKELPCARNTQVLLRKLCPRRPGFGSKGYELADLGLIMGRLANH